MGDTVVDLIAEGRAALKRGDAASARDAFGRALEDGPHGDVVEGLANAVYLKQDFLAAIEQWEQAYAAHRAGGDGAGAVRVARTLGYMYGSIVGDWAIASGWIARAQRLLDEVDDPRERGWVALTHGMFEGDRVLKERRFEDAISRGRATGDADLVFVGLAYYGASLVHGDRVEEGMLLLDESLAAVAGGDVDDLIVIEEIFCQLFSACEHAQDVARAEQWMRVGDAMAKRRNLPAVAAYCHTHFGGLMTAAGRWAEAEASLTEAIRLWALGHRTLKAGAVVRLADLRVREGKLEEAEQLLADVPVDGDSVRAHAALLLARGEPTLACDMLERALAHTDPASSTAVPLLALLVEVYLAAGNVADAETSALALSACAEAHTGRHLRAVAALAQGRLALATGRGDAQALLRDAVEGFAESHLPLESARTRLELAAASVDARPDVALVEARAALDAFERLRAARHVDAASALLRTLGVRTASARTSGGEGLTRREAEVLDLLGHGLSNPDIAERLFISRKTVEHHVGNVLSKLALRTRGEAAAYAVRRKPGRE